MARARKAWPNPHVEDIELRSVRILTCRRSASGKRVDVIASVGNTTGMKAAVSIPDDVFEQGERLARRLHTSRSQLYARALADFVAQHEEDKITSSMNRVLEEVGAEPDEFTRRAARQTLRRAQW